MATTKTKGDLAELMVATDLVRKGYKIAIPFGEDWDFDLIVCREERLERVQVKYTESDGRVISVRCRSSSLTNGKVRRTKRYTSRTVDWIAVYDRTTDHCYYVPSSELAGGRDILHLRLTPALNYQTRSDPLRRGLPGTRTSRVNRRWSQPGSNRRPRRCKRRALPTELWPLRPDCRRERAPISRLSGPVRVWPGIRGMRRA